MCKNVKKTHAYAHWYAWCLSWLKPLSHCPGLVTLILKDIHKLIHHSRRVQCCGNQFGSSSCPQVTSCLPVPPLQSHCSDNLLSRRNAAHPSLHSSLPLFSWAKALWWYWLKWCLFVSCQRIFTNRYDLRGNSHREKGKEGEREGVEISWLLRQHTLSQKCRNPRWCTNFQAMVVIYSTVHTTTFLRFLPSSSSFPHFPPILLPLPLLPLSSLPHWGSFGGPVRCGRPVCHVPLVNQHFARVNSVTSVTIKQVHVGANLRGPELTSQGTSGEIFGIASRQSYSFLW